MEPCAICCEPYNRSTRKLVVCDLCDHSACLTCVKTYLLNGTFMDIQCMNCRQVWSHDMFESQLSLNWRNKEWASHRGDLLFENQRSLFPFSMDAADAMRTILECEDELQELFPRRFELSPEVFPDLYAKIREAKKVLRNSKKKKKTEQKKIVCACPMDGCKGFVTADKSGCGLCQTRVCPDCWAPTLESRVHVCDPSTRTTVAALKKSTRTCPGCAAHIYKIDGCDQMWCTQCHVAFSWRTGEKVLANERVHNPHYYEWVRQTNNGVVPREPGDEMMPSAMEILEHLQQVPNVDETLIRLTLELHRCHMHVHFEVRQIEHEMRKLEGDVHLSHRAMFMIDKLSEQEFRKKLITTQKLRDKFKALTRSYAVYADLGRDVWTRLMVAVDESSVKRILRQIKINSQSLILSLRLSSKKMGFTYKAIEYMIPKL